MSKEIENNNNESTTQSKVGANENLPNDFVDETFVYDDEDDLDGMVRFVDNEETVTLTQTQRLKYLFISPKKLFIDIKNNQTFILPAIISSLLLIISSFLTQKINPLVLDAQREGILLSKGVDIEPIISTMKIQSQSTANTIGILITSVITIFALTAFTALVFKIFSKIFGGNAKFKQFFSACFYISIITYILVLIGTLIQVLLNTPVNVLSLSGAFAPNGNITEISYIILSQINIPIIFTFVLNVISFTALNEFKTNAKGIVSCLIITCISIVFTVISSYLGLMALAMTAESMK